MTTLAQGASQTVAVRDGGTVTIATNGGFGTVTARPPGGVPVTTSLGPGPERRVFGPYVEGASITLTNSTVDSFDYEASQSIASGDVEARGAENPRYSDAGAMPVVPEQTYWERLRKHGRTAYSINLDVAYTTSLAFTTDLNPHTAGQTFIPRSVSIGVSTDAQVLLVYRPHSSYDVFSSFSTGYEYLWAGYVKAGESVTYYPDGLIAMQSSGELRWQVKGLTAAGVYSQCASGAMVANDD